MSSDTTSDLMDDGGDRGDLLGGVGAVGASAADSARRERAMRKPGSGYAKLSRLSDYIEEECDPEGGVCHEHDLTDDGRCALLADLRDGLALVDEETRTLREERDRLLVGMEGLRRDQREAGHAASSMRAERDAALADAATKGARLDRLTAVHARYFDLDGEPGLDDTNPSPEDVWRFDRDFRAALSSEPAEPAAETRRRAGVATEPPDIAICGEHWVMGCRECHPEIEPEPAAETSEAGWMCEVCGVDDPACANGCVVDPAPVSEADAAGGESRG